MDEYIVAADLYLRRGHSSGARDPEVEQLAKLTRRTTGSISRRLGNFQGTLHPGTGLKPVTGEALAVFRAMAADRQVRERLAAEARERLLAGLPPGVMQVPGSSVTRLVDTEQMRITETEVTLSEVTRIVVRAEAQLVTRYLAWLAKKGRDMSSVLLPSESGALRVDLFDPAQNLLIEAKAKSSREYIRYAIGQLMDYRRRISPPPSLAVLLPEAPARDMLELLSQLHISVIFESGSRFVDPTFT
ncbi:hypothetical protein [Modestobacter italicus]|uniref:hypothetical protein n=1 Tax=Modestobacter italicus (strain DSM 44449 / CECT 9708 / BC 501) TaxID=2732864 RepID=UPI00141307AD|nr:hypothetical protein [Modestobacter marinus]